MNDLNWSLFRKYEGELIVEPVQKLNEFVYSLFMFKFGTCKTSLLQQSQTFSDRTIREYCKDIWKAQPCEPQRSTAVGKTGMETPLPTVHEAPH